MAKKVTKQTRLELVEALAERYQSGSRPEKRQILGEFVAITGYHRKHAIRLLNAVDGPRMPRQGARPRVYDEAVREALVVLWEASDRVCGKRLKPLLPIRRPRSSATAICSLIRRFGVLCWPPARQRSIACSR